MFWKNILPDDFPAAVEACKGVCILPIGAMEVHGAYLPLGTDSILAATYAERAAEQVTACVFPELYFGDLGGGSFLPGSIIFPTDVIWTILEHACCEIHRNGFSKIVIFNGHGGNSWMLTAFLRNMLIRHPELLIYKIDLHLVMPSQILNHIDKYPELTEEDRQILADYVPKESFGGHGCFSELGLLYDVCPEMIRLDKMDAVSGQSTGLYDAFDKLGIETWLSWYGNFPNSYVAAPHPGMNDRIAQAMGQALTTHVTEMLQLIREDTISVEHHKDWYNRSFTK